MKSVRGYVNKLLETGELPDPNELDKPSKDDIEWLIKNRTEPDEFVKHYLISALWSSLDNSDPETGGSHMDKNYDLDDIAPMCMREAIRDCDKFRKENEALLNQAGDDEQNAHDFWLTRNGHGAGFWDRGYPDEIGDALTRACERFSEVDLYIGNDNMVHSFSEHRIKEDAQPIDDPDPNSYLDWLKKKTRLGSISDIDLGFYIRTTDEFVLRENALERGIDIDNKTIGDMISHDYSKIERNAVRLLEASGFRVRSDGHSGEALIGGLWVKADDVENFKKIYAILKLAADGDEPFSTSNGTMRKLHPEFDKILYENTSEYSSLIDVDISFLDIEKFKDWLDVNSVGESLDDVDDPLSTIKAGNWRNTVEEEGFKSAGANMYWKAYEANEGKCILWIVYSNRPSHRGDIEFKVSYADAGWPAEPKTSNFLNYTVFSHASWINILLPKIHDFALRAKLANLDSANLATKLLNALQMWTDQIKLSSLPSSTNEAVDDLDPDEVKELALRKFKPRDVPPPEHRAKLAVFARQETTTDSATKDMLKAGGDVDFKNLPRYKDVVIYSDPECTKFIARIPWHVSGKPVSRSKEVTLNGFRRPLYWIK